MYVFKFIFLGFVFYLTGVGKTIISIHINAGQCLRCQRVLPCVTMSLCFHSEGVMGRGKISNFRLDARNEWAVLCRVVYFTSCQPASVGLYLRMTQLIQLSQCCANLEK